MDHTIANAINDFLELLINLHAVALIVINLTETPRRALYGSEGYTLLKRFYRLIELLAGLVTPLAKR